MAARGALVRRGARLSQLYSTSASPSWNALSSLSSSSGVEVQECVRTVGKGVDVHADKTVKEAGSLSNCLQFRGGSLIRLGIPWQQDGTLLRINGDWRGLVRRGDPHCFTKKSPGREYGNCSLSRKNYP